MIAATIAILAIGFNTFATQHFLHIQSGLAVNTIETSAQTLSVTQADIGTLQEQVASIIAQNNSSAPRPIEAIEAQYIYLDEDKNPINMGRRDSEIALRQEYERLQSEIHNLRNGSVGNAVTSNDTARTVIPPHLLAPFIWAIEGIKGTIFFALGTSTAKRDAEYRKKWAQIRAREKIDSRKKSGKNYARGGARAASEKRGCLNPNKKCQGGSQAQKIREAANSLALIRDGLQPARMAEANKAAKESIRRFFKGVLSCGDVQWPS